MNYMSSRFYCQSGRLQQQPIVGPTTKYSDIEVAKIPKRRFCLLLFVSNLYNKKKITR